MLKNYLRTGIRNLVKHRMYTAINVVGLAIGLVCCVFIAIYVIDELSYDRFHENSDRIVRIVEDRDRGEFVGRQATTYGPLAPALMRDLASIEEAVRVLPADMLVSREGGSRYQEPWFVFVDSTFLEIFSFRLDSGDPRTALDAPFSVVLTNSTARKYFGLENPVGQTLRGRFGDDDYDFTVTGVVDDPPSNTHLRFDFLASFSTMRTLYGSYIEHPENWEHPPLYTYAMLAPGSIAADIEAQLPAFALRHMGGDRTATRSLHAQPLTDIRLSSGREAEIIPGNDVAYVYLFGLIAVFILGLACINFTNLAVARALGRAREVGLRKSLGARRSQLVQQFLSETLALVAVAIVLAVALVQILLPVFNDLSGKSMTLDFLVRPSVPIALIATVGVVGLLAGIYPALYLSGFRPVRVLKDLADDRRTAASTIRKGLVVFQFIVSVALIVGTIIVRQQLDFLQNERLGFDKEHVVLVPLRDLDNQFYHDALKERWRSLPGVRSVTASSGMPGLDGGLYELRVYPHRAGGDTLELMTLTVDADYVETYGLDILSGRDFSDDHPADKTRAFLVNESAARRMGWADPVGEKLTLNVWFGEHLDKEGTIIGVVRDFQYHSLHRPIDPIVFHIFPETYYYDYLSVRLEPGSMRQTLGRLEAEWNHFNPNRPFEYEFLDERFDALYRSEARMGELFGLFAGIAIFIAGIGLFGLSALVSEKRRKEIGIRKALGATVAGVMVLLSKDLLKLIAIAVVIGGVFAYSAMGRWLDGFAYSIEISPLVLVLAGVAAIGLGLITVGYHAAKAATADPVKSLRYE